MPTIRRQFNLGAGAVVVNALAGDKFEFVPINPPQPAAVILYGVADDQAEVTVDFTLGTQVVGEDLELPLEPAAGQGPNRSDHLIVAGLGAPGDRIQIQIRNTDGVNAQVARLMVDIRPV